MSIYIIGLNLCELLKHKGNMTKTIQELRKGDKFTFNSYEYEVLRKYKDDDKPLKAQRTDTYEDQEFHNEEMEVEIV